MRLAAARRGQYFTSYRSLPLPADAEEFFYWQQLTFGMKPVTRVNHVVHHSPDDRRPAVVGVVSRMIYSSHYFRDGLEVRYLVPMDASPSSSAFYLVLISRSHSESLAGLKGLLLGGIIRRKVRDSTARHVAHVKARRRTALRDHPRITQILPGHRRARM